MDIQRMLTLPGYSWRRKRYAGDKGEVDGICLAFDDKMFEFFFFEHIVTTPPPLPPKKFKLLRQLTS